MTEEQKLNQLMTIINNEYDNNYEKQKNIPEIDNTHFLWEFVQDALNPAENTAEIIKEKIKDEDLDDCTKRTCRFIENLFLKSYSFFEEKDIKPYFEAEFFIADIVRTQRNTQIYSNIKKVRELNKESSKITLIHKENSCTELKGKRASFCSQLKEKINENDENFILHLPIEIREKVPYLGVVAAGSSDFGKRGDAAKYINKILSEKTLQNFSIIFFIKLKTTKKGEKTTRDKIETEFGNYLLKNDINIMVPTSHINIDIMEEKIKSYKKILNNKNTEA